MRGDHHPGGCSGQALEGCVSVRLELMTRVCVLLVVHECKVGALGVG